jgi:uncharacterized protein YndB with AHSA1/START domain
MNHGIIEVDHVYAKPAAAVWRALTDPALLARWWAPGDIRPIVGHRFELDMGQWGKQACEVLEVKEHELLRYRYGIGTIDTVLSWRLTRESDNTRLTLTHEGFDLSTPRGQQAHDGMKPGWPKVLAAIDKVL